MDIIFPSYSRSFRRFELGQLPATGADTAFSELDAEMARLEEERRRQAEAAAAASAAATPASGTGLNLSVRQNLVDQSRLMQRPSILDQVQKSMLSTPAAADAAGEVVIAEDAVSDSTNAQTSTTKRKIDWPVYVGVAVLVASVVGGVVYYRRRKG